MANNNNYFSFIVPETIKDQLVLLQQHLTIHDSGFKPYRRDNLHMTIGFFGDTLRKNNKKDTLELSRKMLKILDINKLIRLSNPHLVTFPPGKENLYVVRFTANAHAISLVEHIQRTFDISDTNGWIPHITLGKMRNTDNILKIDLASNLIMIPEGVKMCGKPINGDYGQLNWPLIR